MIYKDLDTLPIKIFYRISETNDYSLLNTKYKKSDEKDLKLYEEIFYSLSDEFQEKEGLGKDERLFIIEKEIEHLKYKQKACAIASEVLSFEVNEEAIATIKEALNIEVRITKQHLYIADLRKVNKKIELLNVKISNLHNQLPKSNKSTGKPVSIDEILASQAVILSLKFNHNKISCNEYLAYSKQVESKIKIQNQQMSNLKNKR